MCKKTVLYTFMAIGGLAWWCLPGRALTLDYETEIVAMDLSGTFPLPLGTGWSNVQSKFTLTESVVFASLGQATATSTGFPTHPSSPAAIIDGDEFVVESFFDVFFDIEIEDVDPGADFDPRLGTTIFFPSDGSLSAHMVFGPDPNNPRAADTSLPNFGLIPVEFDVYIGHVDVVIPLPFSIGGSLENDVLKFQFTTHTVGPVSSTFIVLPDGTIVEEFDSTAPVGGGISDASTDPLFGPFLLSGPTTTHSKGPQPGGIPEPGSLGLAVVGVLWSRLFGGRHRG